MKLRRDLLKKSQLYLILDKPTVAKRSLDNLVSKILKSGIRIIQLRDKQSAKLDLLNLAIKLSRRLKRSKTLFIINDHLDVAKIVKADGLHLGQMDLPLKAARKILGKDKIIGISCHNLRQALKAQKDGADYIGIGPVYKTSTKPGSDAIGIKVLEQLKGRINIPYFAIGNIRKSNINKIVSAGATRVAVCREILNSKNIKHSARELLNELRAK
ncbi:MAG: thiamine phosphate synthase [Candidatus Omnitrophota bacterium]